MFHGLSLPLFAQLKHYQRSQFSHDLVAACVVTMMLIPQSLAYAMLAGLPAELGLYASIVPIIVYAIFGSSKTLAVGPVAIASLMTASSLQDVVNAGLVTHIEGAILLALLSGILLVILGCLRLGFLANFLSHAVVSGFITASGLLIALSQLKHILGIDVQGHNVIDISYSLWLGLQYINLPTVIIGMVSIACLFLARRHAMAGLAYLGFHQNNAGTIARLAPVVVIIAMMSIVAQFSLIDRGVAVVGHIPQGMPYLVMPKLQWEAISALFVPASLIAIIGYVESVSVGKTLAAKRRERIDCNQELIGLGAANISSGVFGAFPVTGGFSRSVVNFDAGAQTQIAGVLTAIGIAIATWLLTPYLYFLPNAVLAATIIIAVLSLVDFSIFRKTWHFARSDFWAILATVVLTLFVSVEVGVAAGVVTSILLHLYHTSKPHIAEVGRVAGTEHFRNKRHFQVETYQHIAALRIDESLLFSNAQYLEDYVTSLVYENDRIRYVILQCSAVNTIDMSAMEMLENLTHSLSQQGIELHFSELKMPVQGLLKRSAFFQQCPSQVFLSQHDAFDALSPN